MNYIGGIEGMNFNPIGDYNKYLKNNQVFEVDSNVNFETILNKQKEISSQSPIKLNGGLTLNMNIDDLSENSSKADTASAGSLLKSLGNSFSSGLNSANNANIAADKAQEAMAMGEDVSVHDVMIAAEKAALSMQMATQLRNKLVTAYNEINNIRV